MITSGRFAAELTTSRKSEPQADRLLGGHDRDSGEARSGEARSCRHARERRCSPAAARTETETEREAGAGRMALAHVAAACAGSCPQGGPPPCWLVPGAGEVA